MLGNTVKDGSGTYYWLLQDTDGRQIIVGAAAHDAAAIGNPLRMGGVYRSSAPAVANGDVVDLFTDAAGRQITTPYDGGHSVTQVTADGNLKASAGILYGVLVSGAGVTIGDKVDIKDGGSGGTVILTIVFATANETIPVMLPWPIVCTGAIYADVSITGGSVYVSGIYD